MFLFYQIFTFCISILLFPVALFSSKARAFLQIRKKEKEQIQALNHSFAKTLWFHSASVGELEQAKALALEYEKKEPQTFIIHSVFSQSVEDKDLQNTKNRFFFHLPLDFYNSYDFIFEKFQPQTLVIFAWDTWTNLILSAKRHKVKVVLACAVLSKRADFPYSMFFSNLFKNLDLILPAAQIFSEKFKQLGIDKNIKVAGDTRFDSVIDKIKNQTSRFSKPQNYPFLKVLILASTYTICEKLWIALLQESFLKEYAIWIFPHKIDKNHILQIETLLKKQKLSFDRFSQNSDISKRIVLFDVLGILAFAYRYASLVYVGGALHHKVHNTIEPAYFGCPLLFGKNFQNAPEAIQLEKQGGAFVISDKDSIETSIVQIEQNQKTIIEQNQNFVLENQGSSQKIYQKLANL